MQKSRRVVRIAAGWGRRPVKPKDRIDWDEAKAIAGGYTIKEMELLTDQFLRDDVESVDPTTGKKRGLRGDNPILFEEHIYQRRRREILNQNGVPEPELVQGLYWRSHPEGRRVNSPEARAKGAGHYR